MKNRVCLAVMLFFLVSCTASRGDGDAQRWLKKESPSASWAWKPHASVDAAAYRQQYAANPSYWEKAFAFLKAQDLQKLGVGRHEIDGDNVYASVTYNPSRNLDSTAWEAHRDFIDIQAVIDGEEKIGVHPVAASAITRAYDPQRDVALYDANGTLHTAVPGTFFIFFPSDAHRPNITPGGNRPVKKIVIKLRAAKLPQ